MNNQDNNNKSPLSPIKFRLLFKKKVMLIVLPFLFLILLLPMMAGMQDTTRPPYTNEVIETFFKVSSDSGVASVDIMVLHFLREMDGTSYTEIESLAESFKYIYSYEVTREVCGEEIIDGIKVEVCEEQTKIIYEEKIYTLFERLNLEGFDKNTIEKALKLQEVWTIRLGNLYTVDKEVNIPQVSSKGWVWPTESTRITSNFGLRPSPCKGCTANHLAVDIGATTAGVAGDLVWSMEDGVVIKSGIANQQGNIVIVDHGNGVVSRYIHLLHRNVAQGQKVSKGQVVGVMGGSGGTDKVIVHNYYAVHLDFQIKINGVAVDPLKYFQ